MLYEYKKELSSVTPGQYVLPHGDIYQHGKLSTCKGRIPLNTETVLY